MSLIEKIKEAAAKGELDSVLGEVEALESKTSQLTKEIQTLDSTKKELIDSRDKYKSKYQLSKQKLGFQENEEFNEENLEKKLSGLTKKTDETLKNEIKTLEDLIKAKDEEKDSILASKDKELTDFKLDTEISKNANKIRGINSKAQDLILQEVKQGATFENGKIVFKDNQGQIVRDTDGLPLSLEKKIDSVRNSDDFKPFILAENNHSGSGEKTANSSSQAGVSEIRAELQRRASEKANKMI